MADAAQVIRGLAIGRAHAVAVTLTLEELEDGENHGRPAIGKADFLAWLEGRGADHQLTNAEIIQRACRAARVGRWGEFQAALRNDEHSRSGG